MNEPLAGLGSEKSTERLDLIARLRATGVSAHIDLPQVIVAGDQSSGKSSVLEGLTGLPFPRQDGLCTKFATEIILQHSSEEEYMVASIIPASDRTESDKASMRTFSKTFANFDELPAIIEEAGSLMRIKGFGDNVVGNSFARDLLRIEVSGSTGLDLSVVDLPGLISVESEEQTEHDVQMVHDLIGTYVANDRAIILAVVQAGNDIANQGIIKKVKTFQAGGRTIGVITKPDLINKGTEERIAKLAKNQGSTKLELGFFLVKNPSPTELQGSPSIKTREENERCFFQSTPWKEQGLIMERVGIPALRLFLQGLLDQHIERELPKVRKDILVLREKIKDGIVDLGDARQSDNDMRLYLTRIATNFSTMVISALDGTYRGGKSRFFHVNKEFTRLRAVVHGKNTKFSNFMRDHGEKRQLMGEDTVDLSNTDLVYDLEPAGYDADLEVVMVSEREMEEWVRHLYRDSRGLELPGSSNDVLIAEIYHAQSCRWRKIAELHLDHVVHLIENFISTLLRHIVKDERTLSELLEITYVALANNSSDAQAELHKVCEDEMAQPITYNHYFTDNVQAAHRDTTKTMVSAAIQDAQTGTIWKDSGCTSVDNAILSASLERGFNSDMDRYACSQALIGLHAYYKVAMKTFVDNVCRQVIERHLLKPLPSILCPESVLMMDDKKVEQIACESAASILQREKLSTQSATLESALKLLKK